MQFRLGSMSFGEILDRGLKVLFGRLGTFYLVTLVLTSPALVFSLLIPFLSPGLAMIGLIAVLILTLIFVFVNAGAIVFLIAQEHIGQPVPAGRAIKVALRRFGDLFVTSFLIGLIMIGAAIGASVIGIIFTIALGPVGAIVTMVLVLLTMLYIAIRYAFSTQVVMMEGRGGTAAIRRSTELTAGFRWRIFGFYLVSLVLGYAVVYGINYVLATVLPPAEIVQTQFSYTQKYNVGNYVTMQVIDFVVQTLFSTFSAICMTLAYFDIRVRKEAFDLELVARQNAGAGAPA